MSPAVLRPHIGGENLGEKPAFHRGAQSRGAPIEIFPGKVMLSKLRKPIAWRSRSRKPVMDRYRRRITRGRGVCGGFGGGGFACSATAGRGMKIKLDENLPESLLSTLTTLTALHKESLADQRRNQAMPP